MKCAFRTSDYTDTATKLSARILRSTSVSVLLDEVTHRKVVQRFSVILDWFLSPGVKQMVIWGLLHLEIRSPFAPVHSPRTLPHTREAYRRSRTDFVSPAARCSPFWKVSSSSRPAPRTTSTWSRPLSASSTSSATRCPRAWTRIRPSPRGRPPPNSRTRLRPSSSRDATVSDWGGGGQRQVLRWPRLQPATAAFSLDSGSKPSSTRHVIKI